MKYTYIIVSNHALKRLRERAGISSKSALKLAERAFNLGIKRSSTKQYRAVYEYLRHIEKQYKGDKKASIYGDKVFIFADEHDKLGNRNLILITVIQLPTSLVKKVAEIKEKRSKNHGN